MNPRTIRAGLYGRISSNPEHDEDKVRDQVAKLRELITGQGGEIVIERTDDDISATYGKHRPGYADLMSFALAGQINAIAVWQQSRLWRNRRERATDIDRLAKIGFRIIVMKGPSLELDTSYGRAMAGILGELDTWESEVKSERIREKALKIARSGGIASGGPRPFGYRRIKDAAGRIVRDELEPDEAEIIRQCADRLLGGESLRSIVGDLNDRGVRTGAGGRFSMQGLRIILRSARIAGLREHHGEVVATAVWPAIVDAETHRRLRVRLDGNVRPPGSRVRTHYLTGAVYCQRCDVPMLPKSQHGGLPKYVCRPKQEGGCNGTVIGRTDLEDLVAHYVVARLDAAEFRREVERRTKVEGKQAKDLTRRLEEAEKRYEALGESLRSAGVAEIPSAVTALAEARETVLQLRDQRDRLAGVPASVTDVLGLTYDEFTALPLQAKRELLSFLVAKIVIGPARRGLPRFDPARVSITPR